MSGRAGANVEQIRPCLIGGFACNSAIEGAVPRYLPVPVRGTGGVLSVDMVRLRLSAVSPAVGEDLAGSLSHLPTTDDGGYRCHVSSLSPGRYRMLATYPMGDSTVTVGLGLVGKTCAVDWQQGFIEVNPNKVCSDGGVRGVFAAWLGMVGRYIKRAELVRWDLAYDVPVMRDGLRLERDKRRYEMVLDKSLTEYLGTRNAVGRVKLYDKAAELGLPAALTRLELTCAGGWGVDDIAARWPVVYTVRTQLELGLSSTTMLLAGLLVERVRAGLSIEPELSGLSYRTRKRVRTAIEAVGSVPYPRREVARVRDVAVRWQRLVLPDLTA